MRVYSIEKPANGRYSVSLVTKIGTPTHNCESSGMVAMSIEYPCVVVVGTGKNTIIMERMDSSKQAEEFIQRQFEIEENTGADIIVKEMRTLNEGIGALATAIYALRKKL